MELQLDLEMGEAEVTSTLQLFWVFFIAFILA